MSINKIIGNTPLFEVTGGIYLKLEYLNPSGSVKDRAASYILSEATLSRGERVIEATSGNFGISLAMLCAAGGFDFTAVIPRAASAERERIISAYGGRVIRTESLSAALEYAALAEGFKPRQFENPRNPLAHYETTGPEIWQDTGGGVDIFVCGVGSGGTVMGVGRYLREKNPKVELIAVTPREKNHKIEGIGAGFALPLYDKRIISEEFSVSDSEAIEGARELIRKFGIFAGLSSGAAYWAAVTLSKREENKGKRIVALLPDSADRYFSSPLF